MSFTLKLFSQQREQGFAITDLENSEFRFLYLRGQMGRNLIRNILGS